MAADFGGIIAEILPVFAGMIPGSWEEIKPSRDSPRIRGDDPSLP